MFKTQSALDLHKATHPDGYDQLQCVYKLRGDPSARAELPQILWVWRHATGF